MQTIVYSFSFPHHGSYSSFHHLCDFLDDQIVIDNSITPPALLPRRVKKRIVRYWHEYGEYRLLQHYLKRKPMIFHYLRPENNMRFGWKWKRNHKLILSCHQPIQKLEQMRKEGDKFDGFFRGLACADVVVVLSKTQIEGYKYFAPQADVKYIPLGVDTNFFCPSSSPKEEAPIILTVGSWLRDYKCWANVVEILTPKIPNIKFVVVANMSAIETAQAALTKKYDNVSFLTGISDDKLRDLYQKTNVFFLPLHDAVGNNALLECMSTGIPSVVTQLPSTQEYLGKDAGFLVERHSPAAYADHIIDLLNNKSTWDTKSREALMQARDNFAWPHIADKYRKIYRNCSAHP